MTEQQFGKSLKLIYALNVLLSKLLKFVCTNNSKPKVSSKSIPGWCCMAVAWYGTAQNTSRNVLSKKQKVYSV